MTDIPSDRFIRGQISSPFFVLSTSEIRSAEVLENEVTFQTADGDVVGRRGDVAITAYGGERYPILKSVFYGAYEILGAVGDRLIVRRLIHVRTAWRVISADAEFDYRPRRGIASVKRGGWLYRSDDDDYGVINPDVNERGHVIVGAVAEVAGRPWGKWLERVQTILTGMPVLLTALALSALDQSEYAPVTIAVETVVLALGVGCTLWIEKGNWRLKAAVTAGVSMARKFQLAVQALGCAPSEDFPQMAIWRAAQDPDLRIPGGEIHGRVGNPATDLATLRARIADASADIEKQIKRSFNLERVGEIGQIVTVGIVMVINCWMVLGPYLKMLPESDRHLLELVSIWLPSLLGSLHSLTYRRRSADRMSTLREYVEQLKFVKTQLQALEGQSGSPLSPATCAVLQLLCRITGRYCQEELRIALAQRPSLPV